MQVKNVTFDWLTTSQRRGLSLYLGNGVGIPDFFTNFSDAGTKSSVNVLENSIIASSYNRSNFSGWDLVTQEASILRERFKDIENIHLFEVAEAIDGAALPLTLEFFEQGNLSSYTTISSGLLGNKLVLQSLKQLLLEKQQPISYNHFEVECEWRSFEGPVQTILDTNPNGIPIFMLMNSRLGNSPNPKNLLKNIYDSMPYGSYLVVVQTLHRHLNEDSVVRDYQGISDRPDCFMGNKEVAELITQNAKIQMKWRESGEFHEAFATIQNQAHVMVEGVEIEAGQEISIFSSKRFILSQIIGMFESLDFQIVDLVLGYKQPSSLFLLKK